MSYTVRQLSPEDAEVMDRAFGIKNSLMEFNPGKCLLPPFHDKIAQQIIDAPVREDDVWLISFPRTGSTWCQEMIWLIGNDLDFETARNTIQQIRAPLIEMSTVLIQYQDTLGEELLGNSVDLVDNLPSPRYIKSHLPLSLLPTELDKIKPKIIYTCRNPKDMCVSYYHHCQMFHQLDITFEEFCDQMIKGLTPMGALFPHYLSFWDKRHETNILFLKYEDMKKDLRGTLKKIANFMEKSYTEEEYDKLCDFLSFQNMRNNRGCNLEVLLESKYGKDYFKKTGKYFIRKGQVGDWKNHMNPELAKRFDDWIEENTRGTGLTFD
ncbi:luciferin sulfotransferase [Tribolium madens]|uniref:luciferin sulfotransferase n=1 Tax=Tribolium madens TaxID=41895 RepID=UPI001CF732ED|nr:luciferin sulfotransferase [Tribolium madens]